MDEIMTMPEVSAAIRTPIATLRYWRHCGVGPQSFKLGRSVVYQRTDVEKWVAEQRRNAARPRVAG